MFCLSDILPNSQLECWRKFVLACRRLVKYSITNDDISVADGLLLRFCQKSVELYGDSAITPNMHMHCHLAACLREFGPLPSPSYDILSPASFDVSVTPGPKSVIRSLLPDLVKCLSKLYSKLYPSYSHLLDKGKIFVPSTFKRYSTIKWHGHSLNISIHGQHKGCYVFVTPPFQFPSGSSSEFESPERLAEIEYFMSQTISLPGASEPCSHLLACVLWPMIHPNCHHYGKPVQVWSKEIYEPHIMNKFILASSISSRAIISFEVIACMHCYSSS